MTADQPTRGPQFAGKRWRGGASPVRRAFKADRRLRSARRLAALAAAICEQLGRPLADLPAIERSRVEQAAHLMLLAESAAAEAALGRPTDVEQAIRLSGAIGRLLADLGLDAAGQEARKAAEAERRMRDVPILERMGFKPSEPK